MAPATTATAPTALTAPAPTSGCAAGVPKPACTGGVRVCRAGDRDRVGEWRYALIAGPFEPVQNISGAELRTAWRAGKIAAAAETEAVLAPVLGARRAPVVLTADRPRLDAGHWAIVPAHELVPSWSAISIEGQHPLTGGSSSLVIPLCGGTRPIHNIDAEHLTTLVMSGTTAMTGRTAERIDTRGVADTVRYIRPFFAGSDLVHISNEVAFVSKCRPWTGQDTLIFCARDHYIELLDALDTKLIELTGNHLVDYGRRSLERTIDMYEERGWIWFGGGRTQIDATTPRLVEDHGNQLAFVGCNAVNWWIHAISPGPGVATCDWARMAWQIRDLRRRGFTPIATVQHRELRTHTPPPDLVRDLRRLAEAGAAVVIGSQAHVAHPWDVHYGAYVHYGPGNILFAQHREIQRDATVDKIYLHEGRVLTVARLYTRTEHGQPRLLDDTERAAFLAQLAAASAAIAAPDPAAAPSLADDSRTRPDSLVIRGRSQPLTVIAASPPLATGFVVAPAGKPFATGPEIARFMQAKYPIDAGHVSIVPRPAAHKHRPSGPAHHGGPVAKR
jgi:poly-gamma-glutamate synthesis protein (capsule biosynthesis protein)